MSSPTTDLELVLASGSPRRRELLAALGLDFEVRPVEIDESPLAGERADLYVARLAEEKARERAEPGELVLAADTVVAVDGELLGKPDDEAHAKAMLRQLAGRRHDVWTGVATWDPASERFEADLGRTEVEFSALGDAEIEAYVATGEPMDKAGAYAVQGLAALFVESLRGNYSNVVGLPLPIVRRLLARHGISILPRPGARAS